MRQVIVISVHAAYPPELKFERSHFGLMISLNTIGLEDNFRYEMVNGRYHVIFDHSSERFSVDLLTGMLFERLRQYARDKKLAVTIDLVNESDLSHNIVFSVSENFDLHAFSDDVSH